MTGSARTARTATRRTGHWGRLVGGLALVAAVLVAAAACQAGGSDGASDSAPDGGGAGDLEPAPDVAAEARGAADAGGEAAVEGQAPANAAVQTRAVVATGTMDLVDDDLVALQAAVERVVRRAGGFVADREAVNDDRGETRSATLRLRVPAGRFEGVVAELEGLATVTDVVTRSEDVTTEVIDVDSRIRTQRISLGRLRGFLGRTDDVSELVRVEAEIARREASLRSLRAQQAYLAAQTSLATLTVTMTTPEPPVTETNPLAGGFGAGLAAGWRGLVTTFAVSMTALGAALPFLVVLLAVAVPGWLLLRRRRSGPVPAPAAESGDG